MTMRAANELRLTLAAAYVHGTTAFIAVNEDLGARLAAGEMHSVGVVRVFDAAQWVLMRYGAVDTVNRRLTTLTAASPRNASAGATGYSFAIGSNVWGAPAADHLNLHLDAADPHPVYATDADLAAHAALTNPHGATAAATADRVILRDAAGRAKVAAPAAADDIARFDTIPAFAVPGILLGSAGVPGAAPTIIRSDSTIAAFDATAPVAQAFGDAAAVGAAAFAARRDHRHGMPANPLIGSVVSIPFIMDGGGAVIATGIRGWLEVPFACGVTGWTIVSDVTGSIVVEVRRATYAAFPTMTLISGTEHPTLSAARKNQNLTLTTWTPALAAGDILEFAVISVATVTRVTVALRATRS